MNKIFMCFPCRRARAVCLACVALLGTALRAQNPQAPISMDFDHVALPAFVTRLENATGYTFVYGEEVRLARRISLKARQLTIARLLEEAFRNQPVEFEIDGGHIVLRRKEEGCTHVTERFTVSGHVTDAASQETLIGANVADRRLGAGTTTNAFGFYTLTLPGGEVELTCSYVGHAPERYSFRLTGDTVLNIGLKADNRLQEVVVTGRQETGIHATAMSTDNIATDQIRRTPNLLGEADVLKTIQLMPGVQAGMEGFAGMFVRGGTPDQNLVMIDGVPVYNADHLLGIFSVFTPEAVKNVNLYKGGFPARYGGRLSSVVDVRTNDGDMQRYHGTVGVGLLTTKLHVEGPLRKGRTSFALSARATPTVLLPNMYKDSDDGGTGGAFHTEDKYNYYVSSG